MASVAPFPAGTSVASRFDPGLLTRWPLLGRMLRSGHLMTAVRLVTLAMLVAAIAAGLFTANSKAGITLLLTWGFFWPMLTPVVTPTLGNAYCAVCPLGFVGKRLNKAGLRRSFPKRLRGVWIGLLTLVLGYWAIVFPMPALLGTSTRATAVYFLVFSVTALVTFAVFRDMAWCKHVCPLGRVLATHGKVGTLKITTDANACGQCRTFDCAKACSYHLSPFRFEKLNNMDACTLCTDCLTACDNVHLAARPPGQALRRSIGGSDRHEAWVFLTILAIVGVAIQLDHSLGRSGVADRLPWTIAGARLNGMFALDPRVFDLGKMLLMVTSVAATFALGAWSYQRAARLTGRNWQDTANTLAVALAPLAVMALIPHAVTMFATVNASALANEAGAWLGAAWKIAPLAQRKDAWVAWLSVLPWIGMLWSLRLVWARAGLLSASGRQRVMVWVYGSLPAWLFIGVMATSLAAKLLMPAGAHPHH